MRPRFGAIMLAAACSIAGLGPTHAAALTVGAPTSSQPLALDAGEADGCEGQRRLGSRAFAWEPRRAGQSGG
jgi:hypothetical protein